MNPQDSQIHFATVLVVVICDKGTLAGCTSIAQLRERSSIPARRPPPARREGEIELVFPTVKHLEQLEPFDSADALLEWARGRTVGPVEPQVVLEGEIARV